MEGIVQKPIPANIVEEIERIKSDMRSCSSYGELMRVCDKHRANLEKISEMGPDEKLLAKHTSRLKAHIIKGFMQMERR